MRIFLLFSNILLIGGVLGLYVTIKGMAELSSVVSVFVDCKRSILSLLAALQMAESMSACGVSSVSKVHF